MRTFYLASFLIFFAFIAVLPAWGQNRPTWSCADGQLESLQRQLSPSYERLQQQKNLDTRNYINQVLKGRKDPVFYRTTADTNFTIPVVIHVIYPAGEAYGQGTNISFAQIRSQIEALNAAFGKTYPAYNGQSHPAYAQDARIRFCLARNTGDTASWYQGPGGTEFGVRRYPVTSTAYHHNIDVTSANQLLSITHAAASRFPFDKYLNIWLVKTIGGGNNIMGYAPRPIMGAYPLDGVVMRADIFGDNSPGNVFNLGFGLAQGKVLAHEIGHYLNLYHIFQGGCAGANAAGSATDACDLNGDMICDIEPATTQNIICGLGIPNTCTANYASGTTTLDMINDYMSYADDDCMNTFTHDQVQRMWATLQLERTTLWQPSNLVSTGVLGINGCVPSYLNAQINTNNGVFCAGSRVLFSNPREGNTADSWVWHFPGGSPSSSARDTVSVVYNTPGNYTAVLEVRSGSNTRKDSIRFSVLTCKLDSSMKYMANWYFGNYGSIDFSSGAPVQTTTALTHGTIHGESTYTTQLPYIEGTVSLSDSLGNLLFYSNAVSVWNKNHEKISTAPIFGESDINASTGVCYVPHPGKPGVYFIVGASGNLFATPDGARFVEVDLNTNTVSAWKKFEHPTLREKLSALMTVVPHCNGTDYWIVAHGYGLEDARFYSFLVTEAGIDPRQAPVISNTTHPSYQGSGNQLKANRSGTQLVLASPHGYLNIESGAVYDFNSNTGKVSNERKIPNVAGYNNIQTGTAFSPNEKYFYIMRSSNLETNGLPYWLFQYRVSDMQYNIIAAPGFYFASPFQPGPDNQIYITTQDHYLSRISDPDNWGGVSVNGFFINMRSPSDQVRPGVSIPGFIDARRPVPTNPDFTIDMVNCDTWRFTTICFDKYDASWNFGDGSADATGSSVQHYFAQPGDYNVTLTLSSGPVKHGAVTKKIKVLPLSASISGPGSVCTNDNHPTQYFAPILPDVIYRWVVTGGTISGDGNFPYVDVKWSEAFTTGSVRLEVSRQNCMVTKTRDVFISKGPSFNWVLKDSACVYDSAIALTATPAGGYFEGPGVNNGLFSPSVAGIGNHIIKYTYFDETSCPGQIEKMIRVRNCNIPITTSSDCTEILNNIRIAPNPIDGVLRFRSLYALRFIQVYNAYGQKVAEGQVSGNSFRLPLLAAGMYTARVFCEQSKSYKAFRFMKY